MFASIWEQNVCISIVELAHKGVKEGQGRNPKKRIQKYGKIDTYLYRNTATVAPLRSEGSREERGRGLLTKY